MRVLVFFHDLLFAGPPLDKGKGEGFPSVDREDEPSFICQLVWKFAD